ncbi:TadE/TadG family type IV pilus assembly protein [Pararhizobium sp.]|uniref:TadE/TadG family type IV pilus assembly protein n=1 Tax=Pararhizobium sp. TaxID=1977563 RepID=UPI002723923D|nr:TadE/TadG family type IV pilus assembly protein [Pararhizobium sp.]MDO9418943.1 pilus assembly protein [Pararhizobium sp.]
MRAVKALPQDQSGAAALEFAILAPVFLMIVFSIIAYGIYLSTANTIEQIAADAARTAVAGLSEKERQDLATDYIRVSTLNQTFLDRDKLTVAVKDDSANKSQFTVTVTYDASGLPIWTLFSFALPGTEIRRYATIRTGGI